MSRDRNGRTDGKRQICSEKEILGERVVKRKRCQERHVNRKRHQHKEASRERGPMKRDANRKLSRGRVVQRMRRQDWESSKEQERKTRQQKEMSRENQAKRTWCQEKTSSEQAAKRKRCQGEEISRETALKKNGCNKRFPESSIGFPTKGLKGRRCRGKECQVTRGWSPQVNLPKLRYSTAMFCTKAHSMQSVLVLRNHGNSYRQNLTHIPVRTWGVDLYEHECGIIWAWIRLQVVPRQAKGRNFRRSKNTGKTKQNVPRGRKKCAVQKQSLDIFVTWHLFLFASLPLGISCFVVRLTGNFYLKNITWTKKQNQIKNKKQIQTQLI